MLYLRIENIDMLADIYHAPVLGIFKAHIYKNAYNCNHIIFFFYHTYSI